ncbi:hypothetical protein SARC_17035, partial [Sphaeroforma arctica JP610]
MLDDNDIRQTHLQLGLGPQLVLDRTTDNQSIPSIFFQHKKLSNVVNGSGSSL